MTAFVSGAAVAGAAAALLAGGALDAEREASLRWRERAYEAEARIASLRDELERTRARAARGAAVDVASAPPPPATARRPVVEPPPVRTPSDADAGSDRLDPAWDALIDETLRAQVLERLGRTLPPEQEARLLERLREVRRAAALLERAETGDENARLRQRLSRTVVLLEADRAFRDELGIGLADFMAGLDPGRVEDVTGPGEAVPGAPDDLAAE